MNSASNGELSGGQKSRIDEIEEAVVLVIGERPTADERKRLIGFNDLVKRTGLDPVTLLAIGDLPHVRAREAVPGQVKDTLSSAAADMDALMSSHITEMDARLKERVDAVIKAVPNASQTRADLSTLATFKERMESAERTANGITDLILRRGSLFFAFVAFIAAVAMFAVVVMTFRFAYGAGLSTGENAYVCSAIVNMHDKAQRDRHLQTARDLDENYNIRTCGVKVTR